MLVKIVSRNYSLINQALFKWPRSSSLHISAALRQANNNTTTTDSEQQKTETTSDQKPNDLDSLAAKLKKYEHDVSELKDKYMRALADAENTRTRMRKQVDDAKSFGIQGFCKDLLEVADVLRLAIDNTNPEKTEKQEDTNAVKAIYDGLVMIEARLLKIFEKHNLVQIKPQEGDQFNPNLHDAIFSVSMPDKKPGEIFKVTKHGFRIHDRVIRAAQVGVTK